MNPIRARASCRRPFARRRHHLAACVAACLLGSSPSFGQNPTDVTLKAALIYNVAKFTEWPQDVLPAAAPLVVCVRGDAALARELERSAKGRTIGDHSVNVTPIAQDGPLQSCHVLYISAVTPAQASGTTSALRGTPVLTITDVESAAPLGGIVRLFLEKGQLRFEFDHALARRCRLEFKFSRKLMASPRAPDGRDVDGDLR
jgi:hypothetical protein